MLMEIENKYSEKLLEGRISRAVSSAINTFFGRVELKDGIHEIDNPYDIQKYGKYIWEILQNSYKPLGGFKSYETMQDMVNLISLAILCVKNRRIVACAIYRDDLGGQKLNGCGTIDGSSQNKQMLRMVIQDDIKNIQKYHWVEVSQPLERWFKEEGGNPIPSKLAHKLLHKSQSKIQELGDGIHYNREIGLNHVVVTKAIYGFNSESTYNKVMNNLESLTGFSNYGDYKTYVNNLPEIKEDIDYSDNNPDPTIAKAMEVVIQVGNIWEDGIREITPNIKKYLENSLSILSQYKNKDNQINSLIKNGLYYLNNMDVLECNTGNNYDYLLYPIAV